MRKTHLFLTGEKQVGKSTLLRKLLTNEAVPIGGFHTVRSTAIFPGFISVHLLSSATGEVPAKENLLFVRGISDTAGTAQRFDRLGIAALSVPARCVVMDELGPHEKNALLFQRRVLELLDGEIPVRGVLQQGATPFLRAVAQHPRVRLVTVTEENRDRLVNELSGK